MTTQICPISSSLQWSSFRFRILTAFMRGSFLGGGEKEKLKWIPMSLINQHYGRGHRNVGIYELTSPLKRKNFSGTSFILMTKLR